MKYTMLILLAFSLTLCAQDAPLPEIVVTNRVITVVQPVTLTSEQMTSIISMVDASGIHANVPITVENLQGVNVRKVGTNYIVYLQIK